jgi:hypothetical protein
MDTAELLRQLKDAAGLSEAFEVTILRGYRTDAQGRLWEITVEIRDRGEPSAVRYYAIATDDEGRTTTGSPAESLPAALASMAWSELGGGNAS